MKPLTTSPTCRASGMFACAQPWHPVSPEPHKVTRFAGLLRFLYGWERLCRWWMFKPHQWERAPHLTHEWRSRSMTVRRVRLDGSEFRLMSLRSER